MAFFEGLISTDEGAPVGVAYVGAESFYVVDDEGFRRHISAREVDRQVLSLFVQQLQEHHEEAAEAMLRMMGQDDLFTKGMVDATLRNVNAEQMLSQRLPEEARQLLGMMGFGVVIDLHGEVVRVDMPSTPEGFDDEED
jgi:UDP-2,3-diacylglucosamine pyrophosphatase LpxH